MARRARGAELRRAAASSNKRLQRTVAPRLLLYSSVLRVAPSAETQGRSADGGMIFAAAPRRNGSWPYRPQLVAALDLRCPGVEAGAVLPLDAAYDERAIYIASGAIAIEGVDYEAGRLIVLQPGAAVDLRANTPSRLLLLGGERMDGPRFIWWNFVASSRDALMAAADKWERGEMAGPGRRGRIHPAAGAAIVAVIGAHCFATAGSITPPLRD